MNKQKAIKTLTYYNEWRRFEGKTEDLVMPNPKEIGEAIDVAIAALSDETVTLHDGWVAVPVEPTAWMIEQGDAKAKFHYEYGENLYIENTDEVYKAMLQAAPTLNEKEV